MANDGAISDRAVSLELRAAVLLPRAVVAVSPARSLVSIATEDDFDAARMELESESGVDGLSDAAYEIELSARAEQIARDRRVPMDHEERAERGFEAAR